MGFFSSIGDAISGAVGAVGDFLGGAGSVVGDVASGVLGLAGNKNTNATNQAMNEQQLALAREQFEWQKELAKNQIDWRVEDAKKAGLHPMAALGLQSTSFSPVSSSFTPMQSPDYSFLSDMGQSASYAAMKAKDRKEQAAAVRLAQEQAALQTENMNLQNEGLRLDNEYRQWQLMTAMQGGANQALNSPASVRVGQKELVEGQVDSPIKGNIPSGESMFQFMETSKPGVYTLQPGNDWSQIYEDKGFGLEQWPIVKTNVIDYANRFLGGVLNGMVYSDSAGGWVKANSRLGKDALGTLSSRVRRFGSRWYDEMKKAARFYNSN